MERAVLAPCGKMWREAGGSGCLTWLEGSLSCEDSTVEPKKEVGTQSPLVEQLGRVTPRLSTSHPCVPREALKLQVDLQI